MRSRVSPIVFCLAQQLRELRNETTVMTESQRRKFAVSPFLVGISLVLCALTVYCFAVLKIDYRKTALLDLGPYPDAPEYFAQGTALLNDRWPSIQIGYDKLPSRYPVGYPVLMLPWLKILPKADSILAPFRTNQTLGLLLLVTVFSFYVYLAMPLTGGFAALLLAKIGRASCRERVLMWVGGCCLK